MLAGIVSKIYKWAVEFNHNAYRHGFFHRIHVDIPIISVGGIEMGGSGKTPITIYLVQKTAGLGFTPVVLSSGYGRKSSRRFFIGKKGVMSQKVSFEDVGDEPALIHDNTSCRVIVHKNRRKSASIVKELNLQHPLCILDDGLQYCRLDRNIDIVALSGGREISQRQFFPLTDNKGEFSKCLRDFPYRLKYADLILIKGAIPGHKGSFVIIEK